MVVKLNDLSAQAFSFHTCDTNANDFHTASNANAREAVRYTSAVEAFSKMADQRGWGIYLEFAFASFHYPGSHLWNANASARKWSFFFHFLRQCLRLRFHFRCVHTCISLRLHCICVCICVARVSQASPDRTLRCTESAKLLCRNKTTNRASTSSLSSLTSLEVFVSILLLFLQW